MFVRTSGPVPVRLGRRHGFGMAHDRTDGDIAFLACGWRISCKIKGEMCRDARNRIRLVT